MSKILFENADIQFIDGDRGKNYPKQNDFLPKGDCLFLSAKNVTATGFLFDDMSFISKEKDSQLKAGKLQKNDIVITTRGTIGNVALYDDGIPFKDIRINSGMLIFRANDEIWDIRFLYNYLRSEEFKEQVKTLISGSAVPQLPVRDIKKLSIPHFNKEKQKKISDKIELLNQKIQLNTQTNQTLEAIAQAIFKSWFVDFDPVRAKAQAISDGKTNDEANLSAMAVISGKAIEDLSQTEYQELWEIANAFPSELVENAKFGEVPKGWENTTLSEICSMQNGYAFKSNEWTDSGIPVIKIGSVKPMIVDIESNGFVSEENEHIRSDFLLKQGDIVVGLTGYVGEVGRIPAGDKAMLNQRVAKFVPKKLDRELSYYNFVYCLARQRTFKEYAELNAKGSAQANISTRELLNYPICLASLEVHKFFEIKINELLYKILTNSQESKVLEKTRDLLLPKLLNGELFNE